MKLFFGILFLLCSSCRKRAGSVDVKDNIDVFEVGKLFTVNGCNVYRFHDNGAHYFADCTGSVSTTKSCGKNYTKQEEIGSAK